MKKGAAIGLCDRMGPDAGPPPEGASRALLSKADSNEKKYEGLFMGSRLTSSNRRPNETLAGYAELGITGLMPSAELCRVQPALFAPAPCMAIRAMVWICSSRHNPTGYVRATDQTESGNRSRL